MSFYDIFSYVYFTLLLACVASSVVVWRKTPTGIRLIGVFMLTTLCVETSARWMLAVLHNNNIVYVIYDVLNFIISSYIIILFTISRKNRVIIFISACIMIALYLADVYVLNRYVKDYSLINCSISIYFCFISCMYLLDMMENPGEIILSRHPQFIYAMTSLFYYSISLLFWVVYLGFTGDDAAGLVRLTNKIFLISNLIFYACIFFVIILSGKINSRKNEGKYA